MSSPTQICGWLWAAWLILWLFWAFQSKQTSKKESLASRMSYTVPVWAAAILLFYGKALPGWWNADVFSYGPWLGWLGVVITVLGFAFTIWARATLGSNWSGTVTIKVGHELIRTGPYRFVRHPIYTGMLVAIAGTALTYNHWRGIIALPILWLSFTIKRHKEEQFMRQTFGSQYDDYARTTGAIFPVKPYLH